MLKSCKNCGETIDHRDIYWWHVRTGAIRCHFDRDDLPNTDNKITFMHWAEPNEE